MLLVISILFILGFAAWMWKLGLFSSLIMFVCCVFAGGIAVGSYQYIASATGLDKSQPTFGTALCFGLTFLIVLAIMRFTLDIVIKYEPALPVQIDRGIAAVLGIVSGMIMIAVPIIMLQLMPTSRAAWGYQPYDDNLENYSSIPVFRPDDFLIGMGRKFADGGLGTETPIEKTAEEMKLDWMIARNTADHGCVTYATHENLMKVKGVYKFTNPDVPARRLSRNEDFYNLDVRVVVDINASGDDRWWRLPATQFALYTKDKRGQEHRLFPVGYLIRITPQSKVGWDFDIMPKTEKKPLCELYVARPDKAAPISEGLIIDWVYQVPADQTPVSIQFRNDRVLRMPKAVALAMKNYNFADTALTRERERSIRMRAPASVKPQKAPKKAAAPAGPDPGAPLNPATNLKAIRNRNSSLDGMGQ